jgi:hypothetical protein
MPECRCWRYFLRCRCPAIHSASPAPQIYFCDHGVIVERTVSCRDHALIVDSTKSLLSLWSHCIIVEIADHVETTVSLLRLCRRCRVCGVIFYTTESLLLRLLRHCSDGRVINETTTVSLLRPEGLLLKMSFGLT